MNELEAPSEKLTARPSEREVLTTDAVQWLRDNENLSGCSLVGSLPDISEFSWDLPTWKEWIGMVAELMLMRTPPDGVTIFYQSDIRREGVWVDKAFLVQKAAEREGSQLLWHKILCRVDPGHATFARAGYTHLLCFSKGQRGDEKHSTPDVMPHIGKKTWTAGMGIEACKLICETIKKESRSNKLIHLFCGQGGLLAVAKALGLNCLGIERNEQRAEMSRLMGVNSSVTRWIEPDPKVVLTNTGRR